METAPNRRKGVHVLASAGFAFVIAFGVLLGAPVANAADCPAGTSPVVDGAGNIRCVADGVGTPTPTPTPRVTPAPTATPTQTPRPTMAIAPPAPTPTPTDTRTPAPPASGMTENRNQDPVPVVDPPTPAITTVTAYPASGLNVQLLWMLAGSDAAALLAATLALYFVSIRPHFEARKKAAASSANG